VSLEKWETNTRVLWSWKDFQVYKYNGIPFDAHLARSLILIISAKFSLKEMLIFLFSLKRLNYCHILMVYIQINMFCTWAHWKKCWLLNFCWYRSITLFRSEFYVASHIILLTQYIDKTYSVKQMCAPVLLKLNIKLFFGIKHITQIKQYAIRRQMNECKYIFSYLFSKSNIISKITMPVLLFLIVSFFYGHVKYTIFKDKI